MAQRYEYQDIVGHVILLFVHPAQKYYYNGYNKCNIGRLKEILDSTS